MANLIIKPTSGGSLVLQDEGGDAAVTVGTTGSTTLAGTANALGTVTSGNLSNQAIVMPRFKEMSQFVYETATSTTDLNLDYLNISGSNYITLTPEHTGDIIEFSYDFNTYATENYFGWGIQSATNTSFSAGVDYPWRIGRHGVGRHGQTGNDMMRYQHAGGSVAYTCSSMSLSADTTYYFRMIGMTHGQGSFTASWGGSATNSVKDGITLTGKRWSIV